VLICINLMYVVGDIVASKKRGHCRTVIKNWTWGSQGWGAWCGQARCRTGGSELTELRCLQGVSHGAPPQGGAAPRDTHKPQSSPPTSGNQM
jgi:hypothetical protein